MRSEEINIFQCLQHPIAVHNCTPHLTMKSQTHNARFAFQKEIQKERYSVLSFVWCNFF